MIGLSAAYGAKPVIDYDASTGQLAPKQKTFGRQIKHNKALAERGRGAAVAG
jgi:hypothetical protein